MVSEQKVKAKKIHKIYQGNENKILFMVYHKLQTRRQSLILLETLVFSKRVAIFFRKCHYNELFS